MYIAAARSSRSVFIRTSVSSTFAPPNMVYREDDSERKFAPVSFDLWRWAPWAATRRNGTPTQARRLVVLGKDGFSVWFYLTTLKLPPWYVGGLSFLPISEFTVGADV
jgi:hypothetical protein